MKSGEIESKPLPGEPELQEKWLSEVKARTKASLFAAFGHIELRKRTDRLIYLTLGLGNGLMLLGFVWAWPELARLAFIMSAVLFALSAAAMIVYMRVTLRAELDSMAFQRSASSTIKIVRDPDLEDPKPV